MYDLSTLSISDTIRAQAMKGVTVTEVAKLTGYSPYVIRRWFVHIGAPIRGAGRPEGPMLRKVDPTLRNRTLHMCRTDVVCDRYGVVQYQTPRVVPLHQSPM